MRTVFLAATVLVVVGATAALAPRATVDSYTPNQEDRAKAAIVKAGFRPDTLAMVQDGNFFFTATRGGQFYEAVVTSSGKFFVSAGLPDENKPPTG